jgi:molybdate transport system regulatory protein
MTMPTAAALADVKRAILKVGDGRRKLYRCRMARLQITFVMETGARMGPGKAALLESVQATGSISAAARSMGMDYKRAWLLIDSVNRAFRKPAVERATGGTGGGGATLTPFGHELLTRYRRSETAAAKLVAADLTFLKKNTVPDTTPKI